jgi:hypothetical protein
VNRFCTGGGRASGESVEKRYGHTEDLCLGVIRGGLGTGIVQALRALHFLFLTNSTNNHDDP